MAISPHIFAMSRLNMDFDEREDKRISSLKDEYGIRQTTELIRFLISHNYRELQDRGDKKDASEDA